MKVRLAQMIGFVPFAVAIRDTTAKGLLAPFKDPK
jgi:hypothetical protein